MREFPLHYTTWWSSHSPAIFTLKVNDFLNKSHRPDLWSRPGSDSCLSVAGCVTWWLWWWWWPSSCLPTPSHTGGTPSSPATGSGWTKFPPRSPSRGTWCPGPGRVVSRPATDWRVCVCQAEELSHPLHQAAPRAPQHPALACHTESPHPSHSQQWQLWESSWWEEEIEFGSSSSRASQDWSWCAATGDK